MENTSKVSVLLTTYNRPLMLQKAVKSVWEQTYKNIELIILDDNSDSPEQIDFLKSFWSTPGVVVLKSGVAKEDRTKTTRYASMVNLGLKIATGNYISYLCDDDYYFPQRIEKMVEYLDSHTEVDMVYGAQKLMQIVDGVEQDFPTKVRSAETILDQANCHVDHSSVMHRKTLIEKYGEWDDDAGWWGSADGVFWEKLNKNGVKFYPINEVLDCHVYHEGSWTKEARWKTL